MATKNNKLINFSKNLLKLLLLIVVFIILGSGNIGKVISPFDYGFLFSYLLIYNNYALSIFAFLIASLVLDYSLSSIAININILVIAMLFVLLKTLKKTKNNYALLVLLACISQSAFILFNSYSGEAFLCSIVSLITGIMFMYCVRIVLTLIKNRGIQSKFTIDESFCLGFIIIAFSIGLYNFFDFFPIYNVIFIFALLLSSKVLPSGSTYFFATTIGIGQCFATGNISSLALYAIIAVIIIAFGKNKRILSVISLVVIDLALGYYFNIFAEVVLEHIISTLIGCVLFLLIPRGQILALQKYFGTDGTFEGTTFIIEKDKELVKKRLNRVSIILNNMHNTYKKLLVGKLSQEDTKRVLTNDVQIKCCKVCDKYKICYGEKSVVYDCIENIVAKGLEKNRVSLVDLPAGISNCSKASMLLNNINEDLASYFRYQNEINKEDNNKIIISEQLLGVSNILNELSQSAFSGSRVDAEKEKQLIDELLYCDIISKECVIFENNGTMSHCLVIVKSDADILSIVKAMENFFHSKLQIADNKLIEYSGWRLINMKLAPQFDLVFGNKTIAKASKNINGDKYIFLDLGNNKRLIGICDGKGTGVEADNTSEIATSLIEDFYKAGFSSEIVFSSINGILASTSDESFSAIDLCVVDLSDGQTDFIKLGSTPSVIKMKNKSKLITSTSLPLGIIDGIKPTTSKHFLSAGDVVVIASDGVFDAFEDEEDFMSFINNERIINMNMLSESIIEEAIKRNGNIALDDMTVVTFRIIINV